MKSVLSFLLITALLSAQQPPDATPTFQSNTNLVVVNVSVRGKDGKPLTGLKKDDFIILENGKPQPITVFDYQTLATGTPATATLEANPSAPAERTAAPAQLAGSARFRDRRLMVLFFDMSSLGPADQIRAVASAQKFVKEQTTPADLIQVMSFTSKLKVDQEFTDDRDQLLKALDHSRIGESSDLAAMGATAGSTDAADPNGSFEADDTEFNIFNTDRKLDALESAAKSLATLPEKKALVYFTAGISRTGVENESQLRATVNAAIRSNVSFYAIDVRGLTALPPGADATQAAPRGTGAFTGATQNRQRDSFNSSQDTLYTLASDTGGKALLDNNDLTVGIRAAQDDIQSYYLIGYYSSNVATDGRYRRVEVKLANKLQAKIDYRAGYYGDKVFSKFSSDDKEKQLEEALMLGDPHTELPVALEVNWFRLARARYFIPVAVKIPGSAIPLAKKGKAETTSFDFIGQIKDAKGITVASVRDNVPIKLAEESAGQLARKSILYDTGFTLPPGQYSIKLLARENQSGKMGTFETKFTIPDLSSTKDKLEISSVVWGNQREAISAAVGQADKNKKQFENHPLVQDGQKLIPSITHVFRSAQNMYVYLEVYDTATSGAAKQPSVAATVSFFQSNKKTFESAPIRLNQMAANRGNTVPVQLQVPLKNLKPGEYVCQVNVIDQEGRKFAFPRTPVVLLP